MLRSTLSRHAFRTLLRPVTTSDRSQSRIIRCLVPSSVSNFPPHRTLATSVDPTPDLRPHQNYVNQLQACESNGDWVQALELMHEMDEHGLAFNDQIYAHAINSCAKDRKSDVILGLYKNMMDDAIFPIESCTNALLQAFLDLKEYDLALAFFHEMTFRMKKQLKPRVYSQLLEGCAQLKNASVPPTILAVARKHNVKLSEADIVMAIRACNNARDAKGVMKILSHVEQQQQGQISPLSDEILKHAIYAFANGKACDHALRIISSFPPDVPLPRLNYDTVLHRCYEERKYWAGHKLFELLQSRSWTTSGKSTAIELANRIQLGHSREEWMPLWQALMDPNAKKLSVHNSSNVDQLPSHASTSRRGNDLEEHGLSCILDACKKDPSHIEILQPLFQTAQMNPAVGLNSHHYAAMIKLVAKHVSGERGLAQALELIEQQRRESVHPSIYLAAMYAAMHCRDSCPIDTIDTLWSDFQSMCGPVGPSGYFQTAQAYATLGQLEKVETIASQYAQVYGSKETEKLYNAILFGYIQGQCSSGIRQFMSKLQLENFVLNNEYMVSKMISVLIQDGDYESLETMRNVIDYEHVSMDEPVGRIIDAFVQAKCHQKAMDALQYSAHRKLVPVITSPGFLETLVTEPKHFHLAFQCVHQLLHRSANPPDHAGVIDACMKVAHKRRKHRYMEKLVKSWDRHEIPHTLGMKLTLLQIANNTSAAELSSKSHQSKSRRHVTHPQELAYDLIAHHENQQRLDKQPPIPSEDDRHDDEHLVLDTDAWDLILQTLAKSKNKQDKQKCVELYHAQSQLQPTFNSYTYSAILSSYAHLNDLAGVVATRDELQAQVQRGERVEIPIFVRNQIIQTLGSFQAKDELVQSLKLFSADLLPTCRALANVHDPELLSTTLASTLSTYSPTELEVQTSKWKRNPLFLQQMLQTLKKSDLTNTATLATLALTHDISVPISLIKDIINASDIVDPKTQLALLEACHAQHLYLVDTASVTKMIDIYATNGAFERMASLFDRFTVRMESCYFDQAVSRASDGSAWDVVCSLYAKMQHNFMEPTEVVYREVIRAAHASGREDITSQVVSDFCRSGSPLAHFTETVIREDDTGLYEYLVQCGYDGGSCASTRTSRKMTNNEDFPMDEKDV